MKPSRLGRVVAVSCLLASASAQTLDPAWLKEFGWRELGPTGFGGRIVDIALVPGEDFGILVASATGGLWRSRNNGTTWECIFQDQGSFSIGAIATHPERPDLLWVGTGEANNQRSSYRGDGVYKSEDGGKSWTRMGLTETHHIGRIALDPKHPDTVWVAALGPLYSVGGERGLYKSEDGGASWACVLDLGPAIGVCDVLLDPEQPEVAYAASYERLRRPWNYDGAGAGSGIHKTSDGGRSWKRLGGGLPAGELDRIGLAAVPGHPGHVYAFVPNENPPPEAPRTDAGFQGSFEEAGYRLSAVTEGSQAELCGLAVGDVLTAIDETEIRDPWSYLKALGGKHSGDSVELHVLRAGEKLELKLLLEVRERVRLEGSGPVIGGEIYLTRDGGTSWSKLNDKPLSVDPPYYYGQIRVDPHDPEHLYVLSVPVHESKDGGKSWKATGARSVHVDHHALAFDPRSRGRILLGNDGGLAQSYDGGSSWDHYDNLPIAQFYCVAYDMRRPYHVFGGTQDNGTWGGPSRRVGGIGVEDWYGIGGGDGFYVQVDPRDPSTVYGESQFGALYRLDQNTRRSTGIQPRPPSGEPAYRFNWSAPVLLSHHNPEIVYFGGNRLFKSYDRGDHWPVISPDLTTADPERLAGNVPHCTLTSIAESPLDPNLLLVGTDDGLVQRSEDGGLSWTNLTGRFPGVQAAWWVSRVELSAHSRDVAYVAFTGYREDDLRPKLYYTDNRGDNWKLIVGDLPLEPINVVREDPQNPDVLWVGTDFGVYFSYDRGKHWHSLREGLPRVAVHDLAIHPRDREVVVGTHGRGIFILDVAPLQELGPLVLAEDAHLYGVADAILQDRRGPGGGGTGDREWRASNPAEGAWITYHLLEEVEKDGLHLEIRNEADAVVRELEAPRTAGLHRVRWDLRRDRIDEKERRRPGPRAAAGTYSVVLRIGEQEQRKPFQVVEASLP